MEELQDAIEDAQYMNAMHDDVPRPTKVIFSHYLISVESSALNGVKPPPSHHDVSDNT